MILIKNDLAELSRTAAAEFVEVARQSIAERGQFVVSLSGGSTPRSLYEELARDEYRRSLDWSKVFFFFGDERNVPDTSPESNFRMANEALLAKLPAGDDNVRKWPVGDRSPTEIAADYSMEIEVFFDDSPRFDLFLLGLGEDCHTASLFPFSPALTESEEHAAANWVEKLNSYRLTMTFPVINSSANVIFLVAGSAKAAAVKTVLRGPFDHERYPAQSVNPVDGRLIWLIDSAAASELNA